jgi:hypothetical protein
MIVFSVPCTSEPDYVVQSMCQAARVTARSALKPWVARAQSREYQRVDQRQQHSQQYKDSSDKAHSP